MTTFDALAAHLGLHLAPALAWLARTSLDSAVIAALVLVVHGALGRWLTPAWRYRLWGLVVLRLVLPVLPASPTSLWNLHVAAPVRDLFAARTDTRASPPALQPPAINAAPPGLTVKIFAEPLDPSVAPSSVPKTVQPPSATWPSPAGCAARGGPMIQRCSRCWLIAPD